MQVELTPELSRVVNDLERMRDGSNVHTVNKAIFYLRQWSKKDEDAEKLEAHMKNCRALVNGAPVSLIAHAMRRWF